MIFIIFQLLFSHAFALNITDGCNGLNFSENDVEIVQTNKKCINPKGVSFFNDGKLYSVKKMDTENIFCKLKVDEIFDNQNKKVLSFLEKSSELIAQVGLKQLIENDVDESKRVNNFICRDFPDFVKVKSFSSRLSRLNLPVILDAGILAIPKRLSSVLFISTDFKKIAWSMNFPGSMLIKDAILKKSGRIVILYISNPASVAKNIQKTCLSEWDIISGNKLTEFCYPKKIEDEAIYSIEDKVFWIFSKGKFIVAKKYLGNELPEFAWKIENITNLKLANSYISNNSTMGKK
jgi:hypothetical protein